MTEAMIAPHENSGTWDFCVGSKRLIRRPLLSNLLFLVLFILMAVKGLLKEVKK
jgi:hypothetical protein